MTSFDYIKISFYTTDELRKKINKLRAKKILEIKSCIPDQTDTAQWMSVYYDMAFRP